MVNYNGEEIGSRPGCTYHWDCDCEACQDDWVDAAEFYIPPEYLVKMSLTVCEMDAREADHENEDENGF